jgi:hypothetical protein
MTPNPGSPEALEEGCTCPVLDNRHGEGIMLKGERVFWFNARCPVHEREEGGGGLC